MLPGRDARDDEEIAAAIRADCQTLYHPVGTCAMGVDESAVVDVECRVRGVDGLRVVDASVMPTVPRGNTNAPTIAIAERAADLIRGRTPLPAAQAAAPTVVRLADVAAARGGGSLPLSTSRRSLGLRSNVVSGVGIANR